MAYWFVDRIMGKIIDTLFDYLKDQYNSQTGMEAELQKLRDNYPKIKAVVSAADQAQITDPSSPLNQWIWQLRDAIDEADDLIDDFEYMKHEQQLETNARSPPSGLPRKLRKVFEFGVSFIKSDPDLERLKEVVQKLDRVSAQVSTFFNLIKCTEKNQKEQLQERSKARETGSLPANKDFVGRDKDKEFIIQWLMKQSNEDVSPHKCINISLLSVEGHGGMGKTTLLQHVYEDEIIKEEFKLKMWVCVSNNFDVKKVIVDMLESLKSERTSLDTIEALQRSLLSEVKSKKFLLVLDDIWLEEHDENKWENVFTPLSYGGLGSKILITTRMHDAAKVINKKNESLILKGLEEDQCLELLNAHAFAGKNPDDHENLKLIARDLVKKLYGCPLAAKVIGGVLNDTLDETYWKNMSNKVLDNNEISSTLKLSYIFLPKYLQNCLAFCSIFPQDHTFYKDDLIKMWIAAGFIQPSNNEETMEDIGGRYFDILVNKSFFDKHFGYAYKMHDLLHDLAQSIFAQECFRVEGDEDLNLRIPETVRHLSVETNSLEVLKKIGKCKKLRTLFITSDIDNQDRTDVLTELFKATRSIRLLYIRARNLKMIPEAVECLKHLRYLEHYICTGAILPRSLSNLYHLQFIIHHDFIDVLAELFKATKSIRLLSIRARRQKMIPEAVGCLKHLRYLENYFYTESPLPRSLSNLYHLQFIIRHDHLFNYPGDFFPRDMNNLSNLRYTSFYLLEFPGIGKLKFLQELNRFSVENKTGYGIGELKHMNELRILRIKCLENVRDAEDACNAKLCDKRKLEDLSLEWGDIQPHNSDLDERVLSNLQPHENLKKLTMHNYMGVRSAKWMNNANLSTNLQHIELYGCLELEILPPFGQLRFLKFLWLDNMPKAVRFDTTSCVFESLERQNIRNLKASENWFDAGVDGLFPCLTLLNLSNCPNLQELPYLPPKLKNLIVENIGWQTLNCCGISKSISLETLDVRDCPKIKCISLAGEIIGRLEALIVGCPNLISLGEHQEVGITENIPSSVERLLLDIRWIPQLKSLPDLHPSLCTLNLYQLDDLDCLHCLSSLSSLRELNIENVPHLRKLPDLPPSLCTLNLKKLDELDCLPCLSSLSALRKLRIYIVPQIQKLPDLPPSLHKLRLGYLDNLNCLPSLSSLTKLEIIHVPQLWNLPELPTSLCELSLNRLDNLNCLSSLTKLEIIGVPQLQNLPDLPTSLCTLHLENFDNLNCLPSCLPHLSSLTKLEIRNIPQLQELPNLPPSLCRLFLDDLDNLNCLPSLSSLTELVILKVPQLRELPDLSPSTNLTIADCDLAFMIRYEGLYSSMRRPF